MKTTAAAAPYTTECPAPHYITSRLRPLFLENTEYSIFDMRNVAEIDIKVWAARMTGRILYGEIPPVCRALFLHYPDDHNTYQLRYQYLLGSELMIAPVLDKGANKVDVYFPAGEAQWIDLWTGADVGAAGEWTTLPAPIGKPAVFLKKGSPSGDEILGGLKAVGVL